MSDTHSLFARVIQDHLALKERNSELDPVMPLDRYTTEDLFGNHPLFKSEEQARIEETMDGAQPAVALVSPALPWPGEEAVADIEVRELDDSFWGRSREFDWGD